MMLWRKSNSGTRLSNLQSPTFDHRWAPRLVLQRGSMVELLPRVVYMQNFELALELSVSLN
jgi:hypothetical protein